MRHVTPYRKGHKGERNLPFIGLVLLVFLGTAQLQAQALLCIGQSPPFELRLAGSSGLRMTGVDSFYVLSANRIAIRRVGEPLFGVYNRRFEAVSQIPVEAVKDAGAPWFAFRFGGKWGLADTSGKVVIKPKYEGVGRVSEGLVALLEGGKWGFADLRGRWKIKPRFEHSAAQDTAPCFSHGWALMADPQTGGWRYLGKDGQFRGSRAYPEAFPYFYPHTWVREEEGFFLIDLQGKAVLGPYFDIVPNPGSPLVPVLQHDLFGLVDLQRGLERSACQFYEVSAQTRGHAAVLTTQGWTLIDSLGRLCRSDYFEYLESTGTNSYVFYSGEPGDRWAGLLGSDCVIEVPAVWRYISAFSDGFAVASTDGESYFLIDPEGQQYLKEEGFRQMAPPINGFMLARNTEEQVIYSVDDFKQAVERLPVQFNVKLLPLK
jgi:hypothetical protein